MNLQRIDKIISSQFNISRSQARKEIRWGKVSVDGKCVRDPSLSIDAQKASIEYRGQALLYKEYIYIMMNKPKGVLSASEDKSRQTVVDLVPPQLKRAGLFPVGRLDRDTTGLLLITDDGDFSHKVISPKKNITKTYIATLDGNVSDEICKQFKDGVVLADGTKCRPAQLRYIGECKAEIKISEGKYHQIKRMFGIVNLGVNKLQRVAIGNLYLPENLSEGECIELTEADFSAIFGV